MAKEQNSGTDAKARTVFFAKLDGDRYFSTFDVTKVYWQIHINEEDKVYTGFVIHKGLHEFTAMPFGLVNAPATFNRLMRKLSYSSLQLDNYVDDVMEHSSNWPHHLVAMRDFLTRVKVESNGNIANDFV